MHDLAIPELQTVPLAVTEYDLHFTREAATIFRAPVGTIHLQQMPTRKMVYLLPCSLSDDWVYMPTLQGSIQGVFSTARRGVQARCKLSPDFGLSSAAPC